MDAHGNTDSRQAAFHGLDEDVALRKILEGTASETGQRFFSALVKSVSEALNTAGAWVTEYLEDDKRLRAISMWMNGKVTNSSSSLALSFWRW